jgi:hypothetical protein
MESLIKRVIGIMITLVIIGAILGLGLVSVSVIGSQSWTVNNVTYVVSDVVDPTVLTLLTTVVPIMIVISLAMYFIPKV